MADRAGAVIVAAGSGVRFDGGASALPKQYQDLAGRPVLARAIDSLLPGNRISRAVVVLAPEFCAAPPEWLTGLDVEIVAGGATRSDSVRHGVEVLGSDVDTVLIHDGARPLLSVRLVERILDAAGAEHAVVPGMPVTDTLKAVDHNGRVERTVDRSGLWTVQTPQAFPLGSLLDVHERAAAEGLRPTDDAGLFEYFGLPVIVVQGEARNLKVTTPRDLAVAAALLRMDEGDGDRSEEQGRWR